MILDPFETLAGVRNFLSKDVLAAVPQELKSEVRAAAKLLGDLAEELDFLPAVLRAESEVMLIHLDKADTVGGFSVLKKAELRQKATAPSGSVHEQIEVHREIRKMLTTVVLELQRRVREAGGRESAAALRGLLDECYAMLGDQAQTRLCWQSVFPVEECDEKKSEKDWSGR